MNYLLMICAGEEREPSPIRMGIEEWVEQADGDGMRLLGRPLDPPDTAVTVRVRDGETILTDGPFAEAKEVLGGLLILQGSTPPRRSGSRPIIRSPPTGRSRCARSRHERGGIRAVAVAMSGELDAALAILDELEHDGRLAGYHLLPAARADLLRRRGGGADREPARRAYRQALELAPSAPERRFLTRRIAELGAER